jgi:CheY-like chemotaxis protein
LGLGGLQIKGGKLSHSLSTSAASAAPYSHGDSVMNAMRVLFLEDSLEDVLLIANQLHSQGYNFEHLRVETPLELDSALKDFAWTVILADYSMPKINVFEAMAMLQKRNLDIPFIIITGAIGEEAAATVMKSGAHDLILKDNYSRLGPVIDREIKQCEIRREKRRIEEALRQREELLGMALSAAQMGTWQWDIETDRLTWSSDASAMIGRGGKHCDMTYEEYLQMVYPEDRLPLAHAIQTALENLLDDKPIELEFRLSDAFNEDRWLQCKGRVFRTLTGRPFKLAGVCMDISARKRAEKEREMLINQLRDTIASVKTLTGLLPICANCKKVRDDQGYWHQVEEYLQEHAPVNFTHGLCPQCARKLYPDIFDEANVG